jgi:hypothetical protein
MKKFTLLVATLVGAIAFCIFWKARKSEKRPKQDPQFGGFSEFDNYDE